MESTKKVKRFNDIYDTPLIPPNSQEKAGRDTESGFGELKEMLQKTAELELANYLSMPMTLQDSLMWWKTNKHMFPLLTRTARKWLSVNATSTASERVFSGCGVALTAKRSKMNGSSLKSQIMIKQNMKNICLSLDDIHNAI